MASMNGPDQGTPRRDPESAPQNLPSKPAQAKNSANPASQTETRTTNTSSAASAVPPNKPSVLAALVSPAFVAGVGNAFFIMSLGYPVLTVVYSCLAVSSFVNHLYPISINQQPVAPLNQPSTDGKTERGLAGFVKERLSLPGVCLDTNGLAFALTGLVYLGAIAVSACSGSATLPQLLKLALTTSTLAIFSIGEFGASSICNSGATRRPREPWLFEEVAKNFWSRLPAGVRTCLANPGGMFSLGNLPLYVSTLLSAIAATESLSFAQMAVTAIGASFTVAGAAFGILPLFVSSVKWQKILPTACTAAGNAFMGVAMIMAGYAAMSVSSVLVGLAALTWVWPNTVYTWRALRDKSADEESALGTAQKTH